MKRQRRMIPLAVTVGVLVSLMPAPAGAWPGDLDGSFGACGVSRVDVLPGTASIARAAALQSDGKLVVAGSSDDRGLVMRFDGGALDPTFGVAGRNRVRVTGVGRYFAIAPTSGGGAVVAGDRTSGAVVDTIVARVRPNGTLDPTFHANGRLTVDVGGTDSARAVATLDDGRVLAAGNANTGGYVARFGNDGTPDTSWDGDGRVTGLALMVRAIATRADGSVYVAGSTTTSSSDWRIIRLSSDGSIDTTFGGSNGLMVDVGGQDLITAILVQPDGKVVAAGYGTGASGHGQTIVRRYLETGTPDSSFTNYREAFGINDVPSALTRQPDGHLVVAVNSKVGSDNDIVLARLGDDGTPDDGFGVSGVSVVDAGRRSAVNAVVAPPDGRILAIGSVRQAGLDVVGLFRFQPDSSTSGVPTQGVVVDGFGGLHGWSADCQAAPTGFVGGGYWPGWDIVRGVASLPGSSGVIADAYGGVHGFSFGDGILPKVVGGPYWSGQDIVRGITTVPEGTGGFVLDLSGGLHPFSVNGGPTPVAPAGAPYWPGLDVARGVALTPDGTGGYMVDVAGGVHAFGDAPAPNSTALLWPGQDVARGITLAPDGSGGWILDYFGGLHRFGTGGDGRPSAAVGAPYWAGFPIARGVAALP